MSDHKKINTAVRKRWLKPSYVWAALFTILIVGWFLSGDHLLGKLAPKTFSPGQDSQTDAANSSRSSGAGTAHSSSETKFRVRVRSIETQPRHNILKLRGRTEAIARVNIKAETAGAVEDLPAEKGQRVKSGEVLCQLEMGSRMAALARAKAQLSKAAAELDASSKLESKGHVGTLRVKADQANHDAARAELAAAELDLKRTRIDAAFSGVVEDQPAKVGDYLGIGDVCATLVSLDPILIVGYVSERHIAYLKSGMTAKARLVTGEIVEGQIRFISTSALSSTRTFRVELEVQNPDGELRDGVTADIEIPLTSTPAHRVSPALLSLNDNGEIGIKTVTGDDIVRFVKIDILSDSNDGIWVAGLPNPARIITVGQEYVIDGQRVEAVEVNEITNAGHQLN